MGDPKPHIARGDQARLAYQNQRLREAVIEGAEEPGGEQAGHEMGSAS